jgi:transglycosylase-like protein with SLT domain
MARRWEAVAKAAVLVPLSALSVVWTVSLVTVSTGGGAVAGNPPSDGGVLPDGSVVPGEAIEAPASVSRGNTTSAGSAARAVATASTNGIPSAALAAYQRAETIINAADTSCHVTWQLIAAIGRVESDHGRFGGSTLGDDGVPTPRIVGVRLDGRGPTAEIRDTDAGLLDGDPRFDRAVGPMQFIPATWSAVGVDADGDGRRDPHDIDDAALAAAVYLCSGSDDLGTDAGRRAAVYRYNHSERYVDLVLAIMEAYLAGDYTSVPNATVAGGYLVPAPSRGGTGDTGGRGDGDGPRTPGPTGGGGDGPGPTDGGPDGPAPTPGTPQPTPTPGTPQPAPTPGSPNPGSPTPGSPTPKTPTSATPTLPVPTPTPPAPTPTLLTEAEAIAACLAQGLVDNPLDPNDAFDKCVDDLTG